MKSSNSILLRCYRRRYNNATVSSSRSSIHIAHSTSNLLLLVIVLGIATFTVQAAPARTANLKRRRRLQALPFTNDSLRDAVDLWVRNKNGAEATYGSMSSWNTSQVTDMSNLFRGQSHFNSNELLHWDVGRVTSFDYMFAGCRRFNQNLEIWDLRSAESFEGMFSGAVSYDQPMTGRRWALTGSNLKNTASMFKGCKSFNGDVSGFNTSSVTDMNMMFYDATSFEGTGIENWNVMNVKRFDRMFTSASGFNGTIQNWNPTHAMTFSSMLEDATSFSQDLSTWRISSDLVDISKMFYHATSMDHSLCWANLNPRINVDKIFCGSQGRFDDSCVTPSMLEWADSCTADDNYRGISVATSYGGMGGRDKDARGDEISFGSENQEKEEDGTSMPGEEEEEEATAVEDQEDTIIQIQASEEEDDTSEAAIRWQQCLHGVALLCLGVVSLLL